VELILTILLKVGPYLVALLGFAGAYFYVRRQGVKAERAKWEKRENDALKHLSEKLRKAESKDKEIDDRVNAQIEARKKQIEDAKKLSADRTDGDIFKF
jgi:hypothetical protein